MTRIQPKPAQATAALALSDGTVFYGIGYGASGDAVGELCFNTAMTGYQEILTDPSYAAQIVCFTFPHIGNVGVNEEDIEDASPPAAHAARGLVTREFPTAPSSWRSRLDLPAWCKRRGIIGVAGLDTRALTRAIREKGMPNVAMAHAPYGNIDTDALVEKARGFSGLDGAELARSVTARQDFSNSQTVWRWGQGYTELSSAQAHVVVMDFGVKKNILRDLAAVGARATVVSANTSAEAILALKPDGVVLSNGPGDPAATAEYASPVIRALIDADLPVFGICLGHQLLALTLGAKTEKMAQGHHGANHPVKDLSTGKVEIVSMNHGFTVDRDSLPDGVTETHVSLFDGTNCGIALKDKPVSSVQYHPEASPGPNDSFYLFERFAETLERAG